VYINIWSRCLPGGQASVAQQRAHWGEQVRGSQWGCIKAASNRSRTYLLTSRGGDDDTLLKVYQISERTNTSLLFFSPSVECSARVSGVAFPGTAADYSFRYFARATSETREGNDYQFRARKGALQPRTRPEAAYELIW